mgnify:CR=1 FL=1
MYFVDIISIGNGTASKETEIFAAEVISELKKRDLAYMREMYPEQVKTIMRHVEEMCDRMDYEGSMMYDEYPDIMSLEKMVAKGIANASPNINMVIANEPIIIRLFIKTFFNSLVLLAP